ncbi:Spo0E like sporulation regulatory protein [Clostridium homopropionicum DSM 5847]|uniref:Spo0E like sporulation regulatory protein n=1 Tax=Clostridium homopropionicum DSM 5847 TaxID=1121318 RepID=A0A0L6ZEZ8_9CLOT|nr:aspartyl-phosphate phosphatase Spo0E family protein [Clostridium homopropionicum]KOA21353.1 Spo0E like sporulation regulatory protein [Clostridium homopropionicum DSM 5847]SFG12600.1 Spo0E like sporulation regulatory protein [Clostridium homopropionicum]
MSNKLDALYGKITHTRTVLHALLNYNSPTDDRVLDCSRHLDMLLNKYEQVKMEILNSDHKEAI